MTLENLVNKVIDKVQEELQGSFEVEASGRHVHLSQEEAPKIGRASCRERV